MEEPYETFTVLIARINRSIKRIKSAEMAEFQLKGPYVSCLYYLSLTDGLTAAALCERCDEDKAAISRSLDDLEKNGYITCESTGRRFRAEALRLVLSGSGCTAGADQLCVLTNFCTSLPSEGVKVRMATLFSGVPVSSRVMSPVTPT